MSQQVNYEVHVLQNGQWSIHAHFDAQSKERAVAEAKQMEKANYVMDIKVIRETYDNDAGSHNNMTVYRMPPEVKNTKPKTAPSFNPSNASFFESYDADFNGTPFGGQVDAAGNKIRGKKNTTIIAITIKILIVALVSIAVSTLVTVVTSATFSGKTIFGMTFTGNNEANLLFLVFVASFLITALYLANSFLRGHVLKGGKKTKPNKTTSTATSSQNIAPKKSNSSQALPKSKPDTPQLKRTKEEEAMLEEVEEAIEKSDKIRAEKLKEINKAEKDTKQEQEENKKQREKDRKKREEDTSNPRPKISLMISAVCRVRVRGDTTIRSTPNFDSSRPFSPA